MQNGSIHLRSGSWSWSVREQQSGAAVVFQHRERPLDEMRTWSPTPDLNPERVRELALDPVERLWRDADAMVWSIRAELPSNWARTSASSEGQVVWLVFTCAGLRKQAVVPASLRLGEFTHAELARLLNSGL